MLELCCSTLNVLHKTSSVDHYVNRVGALRTCVLKLLATKIIILKSCFFLQCYTLVTATATCPNNCSTIKTCCKIQSQYSKSACRLVPTFHNQTSRSCTCLTIYYLVLPPFSSIHRSHHGQIQCWPRQGLQVLQGPRVQHPCSLQGTLVITMSTVLSSTHVEERTEKHILRIVSFFKL